MTFIRAGAASRPFRVFRLVVPILMALAGCSGPPPNGLSHADARHALEVLDHAPDHGFPKGAFGVGAIHAAMDRHDPRADGLLRAGVIAYARAQHGLLIPNRARPAAWGEGPRPYDAAGEMDTALRQRQFRQWLDGQAPAGPVYQGLQKAYMATVAQPASPETARLADTLRASMERVRWLPREAPATRIEVNIAAMSLVYLDDGQPRLTMRTASGRPGDETPILTSTIEHVVLNPPWNVPKGIAERELLPKGEDYLAAHGFEIKDDGGLVQAPGPESALGLVKFDFDNPYAVYLHDTPAKAAFDRAGRAVSHGCVRLEQALALAKLLISGEPGWSDARIGEVIASGETTTISLKHPVPVWLVYLTAVPEDGRIGLAPDIYGWDAPVNRLLDQAALAPLG